MYKDIWGRKKQIYCQHTPYISWNYWIEIKWKRKYIFLPTLVIRFLCTCFQRTVSIPMDFIPSRIVQVLTRRLTVQIDANRNIIMRIWYSDSIQNVDKNRRVMKREDDIIIDMLLRMLALRYRHLQETFKIEKYYVI